MSQDFSSWMLKKQKKSGEMESESVNHSVRNVSSFTARKLRSSSTYPFPNAVPLSSVTTKKKNASCLGFVRSNFSLLSIKTEPLVKLVFLPTRYSDLRKRIIQRMESLKVRL